MKKTLCSFVAACCLAIVLGSFAEVLADPVANAGYDQIVFDKVTLNGSLPSDPTGTLYDYDWLLVHHEDPAFNEAAYGSVVTVTGLNPGFYSVILTVTFDAFSYSSDVMHLAAAGVCVQAPGPGITGVSFDVQDPTTLDDVVIEGENFGDYVEGESTVHIGQKTLTTVQGEWNDTSIRAIIPKYFCGKFAGEPSIELKIYVKVGDAQSNKWTMTINAPEKCATPPQ